MPNAIEWHSEVRQTGHRSLRVCIAPVASRCMSSLLLGVSRPCCTGCSLLLAPITSTSSHSLIKPLCSPDSEPTDGTFTRSSDICSSPTCGSGEISFGGHDGLEGRNNADALIRMGP